MEMLAYIGDTHTNEEVPGLTRSVLLVLFIFGNGRKRNLHFGISI